MISSVAQSPHRGLSAPIAALDNLLAKRGRGEKSTPDTSEWFIDYEWRGNNRKFMDAWFDNEAHTMLLSGPAETGKTLSCLAILHQTCLDHPKAECLILRKVRRHCYNTVCRSMMKIWPTDWEEKGYVIYGGVNSPEIYIYPNGSRVYVGGLDSMTQTEQVTGVNALLSGEFDVIYINQGEELSRVDLDKISTRATGRKGGLTGKRLAGVLIDCNPSHPNHPLLIMEKEGSLALHKSRHVDNPDLYDEDGNLTERGKITMSVLKRQKGVLFSRLYEGIWAGAGGQYFRHFDPIHVHGIKAENFRLDLNWRVYASMDYGYAHPNVVLFHALTSDGTMITFDEIVNIRQKPKEIAPIIHEKLAVWGLTADSLTEFYIGTDAFSVSGRSDTTIVEKYQKFGFNMVKADVGPGSRVRHGHALIEKLGNPELGEDPLWYFVRENCPRLESTLSLVAEDPKNPEAPKKFDANSEGEGGDDAADCLYYGLKTNPASSTMSDAREKLQKLRAKMGGR